MSKATYRGVVYDTTKPKFEIKNWVKKIQAERSDNFVYRGKEYHWKKADEAWNSCFAEKTANSSQKKEAWYDQASKGS